MKRHWVETFSYQSRMSNVYCGDENRIKAIAEIENRLGGKVISTRITHQSKMGDADFDYGEALVEFEQ